MALGAGAFENWRKSARVIRLPLRSLFCFWGEAQVLRWTGADAVGEKLLVRATATDRRPGDGLPGSLILTTQRMVWAWGFVRLARALVIPREAVRDVRYEDGQALPIVIDYTESDGAPARLRLRLYSYWEAAAAGAVGAGASGAAAGAAAAAVGTAGVSIAGRLSSLSKPQALAAALRKGLGLPVDSALPLPQDFGGFTWKNLLGFPGFGFVAVLAIAALPFALALASNARELAASYRAAPVCSAQVTSPCRQVRQALVTARGAGGHPDGSTGGEVWLRLQFSDGGVAYADFPAKPGTVAFSPGQLVSAEVWQGKVTLVRAAGESEPTYSDPEWNSNDSQWAPFVPLLFLFLSGTCTAFVGLNVWRQRQLAWAGRST
jgi:hypothetical protein